MKKSILLFVGCAVALFIMVVSGLQAQQPNPANNATPDDEVAVIKTNKGEMVVAFWPNEAPATVENFKKLARQHFYDGTAFHRIVAGFMIQGGDPLTTDPNNKSAYGTGGPGYTIKEEFNDHPHVRGVISMARGSNPDSAGSQFFICLADASFLNGNYTAFGHLIKGEDVLMAIGDTPTEMNAEGEKSSPTERVEVQSVTIVKSDKLAATTY